MKSKFSRETASATKRNILPGLTDISTLYTGIDNGIYENRNTNYQEDEEKTLFNSQNQIKKLVEGLENKKTGDTNDEK